MTFDRNFRQLKFLFRQSNLDFSQPRSRMYAELKRTNQADFRRGRTRQFGRYETDYGGGYGTPTYGQKKEWNPERQKSREVCAQVATSLFTCGNRLVQQADIRMRSYGLRQLVDDKSVGSCQQTFCKLIVKTCYPQAPASCSTSCSLEITSCNKPDFNRLTSYFKRIKL